MITSLENENIYKNNKAIITYIKGKDNEISNKTIILNNLFYDLFYNKYKEIISLPYGLNFMEEIFDKLNNQDYKEQLKEDESKNRYIKIYFIKTF